jgi:calcineurin-like phosphoesterase family protein
MITFDTNALAGYFSSIWLTADLHFGHDTVFEKCKRPWKNLDKMDKGLIRSLNEHVTDRDLLIIVGDLTMHGSTRQGYVEQIISKLPRNKILVFGNHDRFKPKWYLDRGFSLAATSLVLPGGVLVTHDPADATVWPKDKPVLHGHLHALYRVLDNLVDVGVDAWDYKPVRLGECLELCSESRGNHDLIAMSKLRHKEPGE